MGSGLLPSRPSNQRTRDARKAFARTNSSQRRDDSVGQAVDPKFCSNGGERFVRLPLAGCVVALMVAPPGCVEKAQTLPQAVDT
jgi:hypothetical protein